MFAHLVHPSQPSVIAIYASLAEAEEAVRDLDVGDFPVRQISIVFRDPDEEGLVVAGSLARALFDSIEEILRGAGAGTFLRGLMAWGVSLEEVMRYEQIVRGGKTLIISHGSIRQVAQAQRILSANGATSLQMHDSQTVPLERPACAKAEPTRWRTCRQFFT